MNIKYLLNDSCKKGVSGLFNIDCSAASVDGGEKTSLTETPTGYTAEIESEKFCAKAVIEKKGDIYLRNDVFINKSDKPIILYRYFSRFSLETEDCEVYTQYSNWINESCGQWQKLCGTVSSSCRGVRTTAGGAPFAALWDNCTDRGLAVNLLPNAAWKINIEKKPWTPLQNMVVVEAGISDDRLRMEVLPGETVYLPQIIFYDFDKKTDMGCTKLHRYVNSVFPKRSLPVIYNTWFANFDGISYDFCVKQAEKASELGAEYFVVDAGWFGKGGMWTELIGDWTENTTGAFCGRMKDFADYVREIGMKFGLWIEAERALKFVPAVKEHPEYFMEDEGSFFIDFANRQAADYIKNTLYSLIDMYGIEFIKFDFNADCLFDNRSSSFYRYHMGHKSFIEEVKKTYPDIYIENCASGGTRMDLFHCTFMDSIWFSDNQNPYAGTRVLRDTILRLPPAALERWAVLKTVGGFTEIYSRDNKSTRLLTVSDATWKDVESIAPEYMENFCSGGPMGITCDLTALSEDDFSALKKIVDKFKGTREFYRSCVCLPLITTDNITVLQYSNDEETTVILQVFENNTAQSKITVYPRLTKNRTYNGRTAKELSENGISLPIDISAKSCSIVLNADFREEN